MVDAEAVLVAWLTEQFPSVRVVTETPANLAGSVPCIAVSRFGGADDYIPVYDNPTMDFDCYDGAHDGNSPRVNARALAYSLQSAIRNDFEGVIVAGAFVERARTLSGPAWTPYDNTDLRRFTYTAQFRLRAIQGA